MYIFLYLIYIKKQKMFWNFKINIIIKKKFIEKYFLLDTYFLGRYGTKCSNVTTIRVEMEV